jgi:hypothetical protein
MHWTITKYMMGKEVVYHLKFGGLCGAHEVTNAISS